MSMKTEARVISSPILFMVLSASLLKLAYGEDPLLPSQNDALFCPTFGNCTGEYGCRYNRVAPTNGATSFKVSDGFTLNCDARDVKFKFPDSTDKSLDGSATWICYRYYNLDSHHFVVVDITLKIPKDVSDTQIECDSAMGNCTLLNGTSPEVKFITGMPDYCVQWTDNAVPATDSFLPSETENLTCPGLKSCTGDLCDFNRMSEGSKSKIFYPGVTTQLKCEDFKVEVNYPLTKDPGYEGHDNITCFLYDNNNGTTFQVAEFTFSKPSDVVGSQVDCTAAGSTCTLQNDTPTQLLFVAGLPSGCVPWTPPPPPPTGTGPLLPSQNDGLFCPTYANCLADDCLFKKVMPTSGTKYFNMRQGVSLRCDSLVVKFKFPGSKGDSLTGKATWTCFRYYDASAHHFSVFQIILNKPSDVSDTGIMCESTMGDCALLKGASSSELVYLTGMPNNCVSWIDNPMSDSQKRKLQGTDLILPSQTEELICPGLARCTGDLCQFSRVFLETTTRILYPAYETQISCEGRLLVHVKYPKTQDPFYKGKEIFTCFLYDNGYGTTFHAVEFTLSKPGDVNSSGVTCTADKFKCTLCDETSSQLTFVAGLPSGCTSWTPPPVLP